VDLRKDGSVVLNMEYFDYATGPKMANEAKWEKLFGVARRLHGHGAGDSGGDRRGRFAPGENGA
jgi:hypothetical protein